MLVYTVGQGVYGFTLDPDIGEYLLSHERMRIPEKGKVYAANEGNYNKWHDGIRKYLDSLKVTRYSDGASLQCAIFRLLGGGCASIVAWRRYLSLSRGSRQAGRKAAAAL